MPKKDKKEKVTPKGFYVDYKVEVEESDYDTESECGEGDDKNNSLSDQIVVTKYMDASKICNDALKLAIQKCVPGADIGDICKEVDDYIHEQSQPFLKKKKDGEEVKRGVAMPCCIAVNEIIGHYAPASGEEKNKLKDGDLVSIDLGCHMDGYIAQAAHTILLGDAVDDRRADVYQAAKNCAEAACRMIKKGEPSEDITKVFGSICKDFNCVPVKGAQSRQMKQHVIDGNKGIMMAPMDDAEEGDEDEDFKFQENHVFAIDIMVSTGEGKYYEMDNKDFPTTVFKYNVDVEYALKTPKGRKFLSMVKKQCPTLPFHNRKFLEEDKLTTLMGQNECVRNELLEPYVPMKEKKGEYVAQFKFTIGCFPTGPKKLTGLPFNDPLSCNNKLNSKHKVEDEMVIEILKRPQPGAKKKNNKKKKYF